MKSNKVKGLFITGTDTDVGKTYVTEKILQQLCSQSISCVAMKPVASGAHQTPNGLRNDDALRLQQASSVEAPYDLVNPYCFEPAIAPHIAAHNVGVIIEPKVILNAFEQLSLLADVVIVEGVGGWQVPLNSESDTIYSIASLAKQLQLPVVLVVGLRIGCLNHALLTHYSIYNEHCPMAGWIANSLNSDFQFTQQQIELLRGQITSPLLGKLTWKGEGGDKESSQNNLINDQLIDLDHCLNNS